MDPKVKRRMLKAQDEILNLQRRDMNAKQKTVSKMKRWSTMKGFLRKGKEKRKKLMQVMKLRLIHDMKTRMQLKTIMEHAEADDTYRCNVATPNYKEHDVK